MLIIMVITPMSTQTGKKHQKNLKSNKTIDMLD